MGRGREGQPVLAWLRGVTRDLERIFVLVVCWSCSFPSLEFTSLCLARAAWGSLSLCWPGSSSLGARSPPLFKACLEH